MEGFARNLGFAARNLGVEAGELQHQRPHIRRRKGRIERRQQLSATYPLAFLNVDCFDDRRIQCLQNDCGLTWSRQRRGSR